MPSSTARAWGVALALIAAFALGCLNSEEEGALTGSVCDPALTYEDDIAPLMDHYCISCHGAGVPLKSRNGAPGDHNFDTLAEVLENAMHIQMRAGVGPDAQNRSMPPKGFSQPSDEERITLARFLECQLEAGDSTPAHHHH
jgi:uncharacterized membrane protein